MFVPFISDSSNRLFKRKGGGGGGGGRGGGGSKSGSGTKSSSGFSSTKKTSSISSGFGGSSTKWKTSTYGTSDTISTRVIPVGQPFAGRTEGGGSRAHIFGTRTYGSGYPDYPQGRGVAGRGFPFVYWPIVWPHTVNSSYLHSNQEASPLFTSPGTLSNTHTKTQYGAPSNTTRPGGALAYATFPSNSSNPPTVIFRLLADNDTVFSLIQDVTTNCTTYLSTSASPPNSLSNTTSSPTPFIPPYTFSNTTGPANPQPEQVVQYYRASTVALTLDSYNNSATYSNDTNAPDSPLPMLSKADTDFLECLNTTIGLAAPLVSGGSSLSASRVIFPGIRIYPSILVFWFVWWWFWHLIF